MGSKTVIRPIVIKFQTVNCNLQNIPADHIAEHAKEPMKYSYDQALFQKVHLSANDLTMQFFAISLHFFAISVKKFCLCLEFHFREV